MWVCEKRYGDGDGDDSDWCGANEWMHLIIHLIEYENCRDLKLFWLKCIWFDLCDDFDKLVSISDIWTQHFVSIADA